MTESTCRRRDAARWVWLWSSSPTSANCSRVASSMSLTGMQPPSASNMPSMIDLRILTSSIAMPEKRRAAARCSFRASSRSARGRLSVALAAVAHAHADVHQELVEAFLILEHVAPERRVVEGHRAMHQRPGGAVVEVRRHVLQLAFGDAALDQLGEAREVGGANVVQLFNQLRHLVALRHLFLEAVEQAIALGIAHAELEIGPRQRLTVPIDVLRVEQFVEVALVVEHQPQVDFGLGLEVLVDGAFADSHGVRDHLDSDTVFSMLEEQFQSGVENFLLTAAKLSDLAGFFLHKDCAAHGLSPLLCLTHRK